MTFNELDTNSQSKVIGFVFGLGSALFGSCYFFFDFFKSLVSTGWYAGIPIWIACIALTYPLGKAAAKAATSCDKCGAAWSKHQRDQEDILQVFPRTEKEQGKIVHYEVTRYRIYHDCNKCGHQTHKDKQRSRKLY